MTTKETSASPYELRLQMIEMAKDYLDRQYEQAVSATMSVWQENLEFAKKMGEMVKEPVLPKIYSMDEVFKIAEQFNNFVSGIHKK